MQLALHIDSQPGLRVRLQPRLQMQMQASFRNPSCIRCNLPCCNLACATWLAQSYQPIRIDRYSSAGRKHIRLSGWTDCSINCFQGETILARSLLYITCKIGAKIVPLMEQSTQPAGHWLVCKPYALARIVPRLAKIKNLMISTHGYRWHGVFLCSINANTFNATRRQSFCYLSSIRVSPIGLTFKGIHCNTWYTRCRTSTPMKDKHPHQNFKKSSKGHKISQNSNNFQNSRKTKS